MNDIASIIAYFVMWFLTFIFYVYKKKSIGIGGALLLVYAFTSSTSIYYYNNSNISQVSSISFVPFLYLYICTLICIFPFLKYSDKIDSVKLDESCTPIINTFLLVCSPIIFEALFEMLYISLSTSSSALGRIYESEADVVGDKLSFIGRKTMAVVRWFSDLWVIFFFYTVRDFKRNKIQVITSLLAFLCIVLEGYSSGSRVAIVRPMMSFFIGYLLFSPFLLNRIKLIIKNTALAVGTVFILFLILITVSRFNDLTGDSDILTWLSLYTGEGCIRFSQYAYDLTETSNGDNCFSLFKNVLGLDTFTDLGERRDYYEMKLGIPTIIFYTFIGDWYIDLGFWGTICLCIIVSMCLSRLLKNIVKKSILTLVDLLIISVFALMFMFGFMYFSIKNYYMQLFLAYSFLLLYVFRFISKRK